MLIIIIIFKTSILNIYVKLMWIKKGSGEGQGLIFFGQIFFKMLIILKIYSNDKFYQF